MDPGWLAAFFPAAGRFSELLQPVVLMACVRIALPLNQFRGLVGESGSFVGPSVLCLGIVFPGHSLFSFRVGSWMVEGANFVTFDLRGSGGGRSQQGTRYAAFALR